MTLNLIIAWNSHFVKYNLQLNMLNPTVPYLPRLDTPELFLFDIMSHSADNC